MNRKFSCFCCGWEFNTLEEFTNHIVNTHDEGRDYVRCCLEHCQVPVRDLASHMKAKHPGVSIPKNCQMKAMIWKDTKTNRTKKPRFHEGVFHSKKCDMLIRYRSGYEKQVYEHLEKLDEIIFYKAEPVRVKYCFKGKVKTYIPDLLINFKDGHREIWEVKPAKQSFFEINQAKWAACNEYCKNNGWEFKVITEMGINKLNILANKKTEP